MRKTAVGITAFSFLAFALLISGTFHQVLAFLQ